MNIAESQFGWGSVFHLGLTTNEAVTSANALLLQDAYRLAIGKGNMSHVLASMWGVAKSPFAFGFRGRTLINEYRSPGSTGSKSAENTVKALMIAGGTIAGQCSHGDIEKFRRHWYRKHWFRAAARSPFALSELMASPIMKWIVPKQKIVVFDEMVQHLMRDNPDKFLKEMRPELHQIYNLVEARLGQVHYYRRIHNAHIKRDYSY